MRRWVILNGILAVIVLGLGVQIVRTWARALPPVDVRAGGKAIEAPTRPAEGGTKRGKRGQTDKTPQTPVVHVTAIVTKDLFDPSRAKPSEDAKVESAVHETAPPPGISLVGIRIAGKDSEGFILDATQANTQRRIRPGDTVGNFTVKRIRQRSVVLVSGAGDYVTLSLEIDTSKSGAATGAPPARPGRPQPGAAAAAANAGPSSPAAGVAAGSSPAAGIGGTKPPVVAAGTAANPPQPPAPPGQPAPARPGRKGPLPGSPNLPDGVRQKLEQMRNQGQK